MKNTFREKSFRVLLAEDDTEMRKLLKWHLNEAGFQVTECADGDALQHAFSVQENTRISVGYDLIISDHRMPGMSGLDVLENRTADQLDIPVILITAFPDKELINRASEKGYSIISKPFDAEDLFIKINEMLIEDAVADPGGHASLIQKNHIPGIDKREYQAATVTKGLTSNISKGKRKGGEMPIITISRGAYSKGKEIAERLAERLGYECVSRDILLEASEQFNIPEVKLERALHDAPSILERFSHGKERFVAYIRKALLEHVANDNVVYHGLAGQFFLKDISHVIKVRIISNIDDRVKEEMQREGITERKARYMLKKDDDERRKWGLHLYGIDAFDTMLYDIVLHIDTLTVDDAVDILEKLSKHPSFQSTPESRKTFEDVLLSARIEAAIVEEYPGTKVSTNDNTVLFNFPSEYKDEDKILGKIKELTRALGELPPVMTNIGNKVRPL